MLQLISSSVLCLKLWVQQLFSTEPFHFSGNNVPQPTLEQGLVLLKLVKVD